MAVATLIAGFVIGLVAGSFVTIGVLAFIGVASEKRDGDE